MNGDAQPRRGFDAWFLRFCARFGAAEVPFGHALLALGFFVSVRNYLELSLFGQAVEPRMLAHYSLFYVGVALSLVLVLHGLTARPIGYVARLVFPGMIVVLLPPLLDATVFAGVTAYDYLPPGDAQDLLYAYLTWFGPITDKGVTPGMRIEIAFAALAAFAFVRAHTGSVLRGVAGAWLSYSVLFVWVALPAFVELPAELLGARWEREADTATRLLAVLCVLLLVSAFARQHRTLFGALVADLRVQRLVHYELCLGLGLVLGGGPASARSIVDYAVRALVAGLALAFAWLFAVINNNLFDLELDRINAPERPLVRGVVEPALYANVGWVALALALVLGFVLHAGALLLVGLFCAAYHVYSSPPLRLKERCAVSKLVIGLNSVACVALGAGLVSGYVTTPLGLALVVFVWCSLGAHLIDLKDVPGDRAAGIRNLSTWLGQLRAQRIIGAGALLAHVGLAYALREDAAFSLGVAAVGPLQLWFVTRTPYREAPVLFLQNVVTVLVILCVAR